MSSNAQVIIVERGLKGEKDWRFVGDADSCDAVDIVRRLREEDTKIFAISDAKCSSRLW